MTTAFEVETIFRIVNRASPTITAILRQIRELNGAIEKAKVNLNELTVASGASLTPAIAETQRLATAWGEVATQARAARTAIGNASGAAARAAIAPPAGVAAAAGGGGRARLGNRIGMGGAHVTGPGFHVPHVGGVNFRGGAMAAAGIGGYAAYEAAEMEDAVFHLMYHSGVEYNDANRDRFRKILQESIRTSGYSLHDIKEAATQEIRMFSDTTETGGPAAGIAVLPEMLKAATMESRLKGGNPEGGMKALIGLAHMTKQYDPESIKKLAKDFAFLSIHNPSSLESMERAASYAVPILQSGMEIDPMTTLLLGTALTRAGATNTKSGTWLRQMTERAMPGTTIFDSAKKAERHDELLERIGLLKDGKATWLTDGKPDPLKMLAIAHEGLAKIPLTDRVGVEHKLFGAQGEGAMALLSDNAVYEQIRAMNARRLSPEWANRYSTFNQAYLENSTVQQSRTAIGDFNNAMMDIGQHVLPAVSGALKDFKGAIEFVNGLIPGAKKGDSVVGTRALEGAALGAAGGLAFGGIGAIPGAAVGGVLGTALGVMEQQSKSRSKEEEKRDDDIQSQILLGVGGLSEAIKMPQKTQLAPITVQMNLDGKAIGDAVFNAQAGSAGFSTQAPAGNATGQFNDPTHNLSGN